MMREYQGQTDRASSQHGGDAAVPFSCAGGIDHSQPPNRISEPFVWQAENLYYPRAGKVLATRPGGAPLLTAALGVPIRAMHVFTVSRTQSYLVVAAENAGGTDYDLHYVDLAGPTYTAAELSLGIGAQAKLAGDRADDLDPDSYPAPTFKTINGRLLVAGRGQYLREWGGALTGTLDSYDFNGATAVDPAANTIDLGVTPPGADTAVRVRAGVGATLPTGLVALRTYFVRVISGTTCKLSTTPTDEGIVDITADGSGTCTLYKVPAAATAVLEITGVPVPDTDDLVIGARAYTWEDNRTITGTVAKGASKAEAAANLKTAIDQDSTDVRCLAVQENGSGNYYVCLEYRRTGTSGNSAALSEAGTAVTITTSWGRGVAGAHLDVVDSYDAPKPGIVLGDKNGRVVAGDCTVNPDRVYWSAAGAEFEWSPALAGEVWDLGFREGNFVAAICPWLDELWVHKRGQDREVKRTKITQTAPGTWSQTFRQFDEVNAAVGARAAASIGGRQICLDDGFIGLFAGDDTYNEVQAGLGGAMVYDLLPEVVAEEAFIATNPAEHYALIFPRIGPRCLVYHYGDGRWSSWRFRFNVTAAVYCEPLGRFLLADDAGQVYWLNPAVASDGGEEFTWTLETRALEGELSELVAPQFVLDYRSRCAGAARIEAVINRGAGELLDEFTYEAASPRVWDWRAVRVSALATTRPTNATFTRFITNEVAPGELLAFRIVGTGALEINGAQARVAREGRAAA